MGNATNENIVRVKSYFIRKMLRLVGLIFGFGSISFLTMCAKYGDIYDSSGRISGKVTSSKTGEAIKNIEITLKEEQVATKSDQDGNFGINGVSPMQYTVEAKDIDSTQNGEYQTSAKTIQLNASEDKNCDFSLDPK
jgi:putative lipoprotein (rSAM/lipoprotein system)